MYSIYAILYSTKHIYFKSRIYNSKLILQSRTLGIVLDVKSLTISKYFNSKPSPWSLLTISYREG